MFCLVRELAANDGSRYAIETILPIRGAGGEKRENDEGTENNNSETLKR